LTSPSRLAVEQIADFAHGAHPGLLSAELRDIYKRNTRKVLALAVTTRSGGHFYLATGRTSELS
jgi:hypothetical protein